MTSYLELIANIEKLSREAERERKKEVGSVVKTIKKQIAEYGLTAKELGFSVPATQKAPSPSVRATKGSPHRKSGKLAKAKVKVPPKYRDAFGNEWTGRGRQPKWLVEALASGHSLESLLIRNA